ncbi:MAG TPA: hypothetical protein VMV83_15050 [Rectinemataceae bacterium]|nr:hypothetical protein [Rectinemataceae bacterium]
MKTYLTLALILVVVGMAGAQSTQPASGTTATVDLSQAPGLLTSYCSPCHDWASDYTSIMDSGVIVAGDSASSPAWVMISSGRMPASGPAPTEAEQKLIKDWIDAGAVAPKK